MSLKKKNRKLIIKLLFIFIYIFPVKGLGYFSGFPTSELSIGNNFRIMIGTDWIL